MKYTEKEVEEKLAAIESSHIRNKTRFEMLGKKTYQKVIALNEFFNKYVIEYRKQYNRTFVYYDTKNKDLELSGISLFKGQKGNSTILTMCRSNVEGDSKILEKLSGRKFSTPIGADEGLEKKMSFLVASFKDMFATGVGFDPEYLLKKIVRAYEIHTLTNEYRIFNGIGLKIKMVFDTDEYTNYYTGRKNTAEILTLYQLSDASTDEAYFDFVSKLERYCQELTPSAEHKTTIMQHKTKELPKAYKNKKETKKP